MGHGGDGAAEHLLFQGVGAPDIVQTVTQAEAVENRVFQLHAEVVESSLVGIAFPSATTAACVPATPNGAASWWALRRTASQQKNKRV